MFSNKVADVVFIEYRYIFKITLHFCATIASYTVFVLVRTQIVKN